MTEYKEVSIYGTITIWDGSVYSLLTARPVFMDGWLEQDERCFLVVPFDELFNKILIARYIIVRGSYLIDFALAGRKVKIQVQEVTPLDKLDEEIERQIAERVAVAPV